MTLKRSRSLLIAIIGFSLLLRGVFYFQFSDTAFPWFPEAATESDMHANWEWSDRILAGDLLGRDTYHPDLEWMKSLGSTAEWHAWWGDGRILQQEPMYVCFLAALRWLLPGDLHAVALVQLLVGGILLPLAVFLLGREILGGRVGLYGAAVAAVFGPGVFYQCAVLRDWAVPIAGAFSLFLAIRAIRRDRGVLLFAAGVAFGGGAMLKSSAVVWLLVCAAWLLFLGKPVAEWKGKMAGGGLLALGFLLGLAPLMTRNLVVGAPVLALSNRMPEGLIQGNAVDAFPTSLCHPASQREILKAAGGSATQVAREIVARAEGRLGDLARVQGIKVLAQLSPVDFTDNLSYEYGRERLPVLRFCPSWGVLVALAVPGFLAGVFVRRGRAFWLWGVFSAVVVVLVLPIALGRYRLEALPLLAICAGQTIRWVEAQVYLRRRAVGVGVAVCVVLLMLISVRFAGFERFRVLAGDNEYAWMKLQGLQLANRLTAMNVYSVKEQFIDAAREARDLSAVAARYPQFQSYAGQAKNSEVRLLVQAAYRALRERDESKASAAVLQAREALASAPPEFRRTANEMASYFAEVIPPAMAQEFARLVVPARGDDTGH